MKKLLALLLTCAMVLSLGLLASCGQTDPGDANGDSQSAAETDGQNTDTNTGDLEKIVFTEDVRGYHWAPAYLAQTWVISKRKAWTRNSKPSRAATPLPPSCPATPSSA